MKRKWFTLILALSVVFLFVVTGLYAGTDAKDVITMDYNKYTKRKKGPKKFKFIEFTHKKHAEEYKVSCGDCHHDEDNKPLDLKYGDEVQHCAECHNLMAKPKKDKKDIMALENAMHGNCITCHKEVNIKAGDPKGKKGPAPVSCKKCHLKNK